MSFARLWRGANVLKEPYPVSQRHASAALPPGKGRGTHCTVG